MDPLVLSLKLVENCGTGTLRDRDLAEVPQSICAAFDADLDFTADGMRLYATLGQFSLIRLERDTQLLIPAYDYCMPERECPGDCPEEDPCDLFRHVQFPVDEFFPADRGGCGCSN